MTTSHSTTYPNDLIALVADKDISAIVKALLLERYNSLQIKAIKFDCEVSYQHDAIANSASDLLRKYLKTHRHALVILDRHGSNKNQKNHKQRLQPREEIEQKLEAEIVSNGWEKFSDKQEADRCAVVVIDPEVEAWVWSNSPKVAAVLGWPASPPLRDWLITKGFLESTAAKPANPKEAFRAALKEIGRPPSASIFTELAQQVSVTGCTDPAFGKLTATLQKWFRG